MKKKKNLFDNREDELHRSTSATGSQDESRRQQTKKRGSIYKARVKAAAVFPPSVEEDVDLGKLFGKEECLDDKDSMWLSSDCTSLSSFFEEYRLSGPFHRFVDDWLVSWLSTLADSYLKLDQEITPPPKPRMETTEEMPTTLVRTIPGAETNLQENLKETGNNMLLNSPGNDSLDSFVTTPESVKSSSARCCQDSTSSDNSTIRGNTSSCDSSSDFDNSSSPLSTNLDSSSQISDSERTDFWTSLVNLNEEDSEWISDTELGSDLFQCGSPSPSYNTSLSSDVLSLDSGNFTPTGSDDGKAHCNFPSEPAFGAAELEDDEPLFWPFARKFDWSSEDSSKYFSISPQKGVINTPTPDGTPPESIKWKLKNGKDRCKRRLLFGSGSESSDIILRNRNVSNNGKHNDKNNGIKRFNSMTARLRKSAKVAPLELADDIAKPTDGKLTMPKLVRTDRSFLEDDVASNEDCPIEKLLGLGEFDGHEGIDSEYSKDVFFMDDSFL
ncbi:hypothetical protein CFOL_v3_33481 [Cephalotus follicularis]|uniref:Uncharacterized protein n=1 Tax=Cephalotus follicularis TaxID=3775 RepID=A0A1Q3DC80_CEPFO|nr:hypothetical protein CFOL_v3_33481 [Cephalotus follicularis]